MADTPTATPATPDEGFLHSLATSLGIDPEAVKAAAKSFYAHPLETAEEVGGQQVTELAEAAKHPIDTAKNVAEGVASAITNPEAQATAKTRFKKPGVINKLVGAEEYATGAVPLVGGGLAKAEEQGVQGNLPGEAGTMVGTLAPVFAGEAEDIPAKIHEAGAEARTNIEARRAANIAEAKTGKIIDVKLGVPTGLPAAPENLESEFSKLGGKKIAEPEPVPDLVTNETQPPAEIKTEGPAWDRTHSAFVDDEKVGSVGYKLDPTGRAQIYGSQVNPELRGQGIGQQMYRSVIDEAREAGANRVTSDSTNTTPDANRVWDKLQEKGLPVENITHPNGKPGYQIDFSKTPQVAPNQSVIFSPEILGDTGKYVGGLAEKPEPEAYHPDLQKVADKYGVSDDAQAMTRASFITPDGKFVHLPTAVDHPDAIRWASGQRGEVVPFLNNTGAIRVRFSPTDKAGPTSHISVPAQGVTAEQIPAIQQAVAKAGRNGNVVLERADVTPETADKLTMTKEFPRASETEDYLRQIQAHPDQAGAPDLQTSERQSELKEPYSIKIKDPDGTEHVESIEAFSPKNALATAQKQFPTANEWGIESFGERTPSTAYTVPTQKPLSILPLASYSFPHTMTHELGHALIGQNEGLVQKGMLRHTHPDVSNRAVASVGWKAADLYQGGRRDLLKSEKLPAVVRTFMGGIAADEAFNDMPRGANVNLSTERPGSDGNVAYRFLRAAGYDHDQAMDYMHQSIDYAKEYLTKPAISDLIKENVGVREKGLSTQYHFSSERLANMHAEAQRRLANGPEESGNDRTTGGGRNPNRPADVAAGEKGIAQAAGPADNTAEIVQRTSDPAKVQEFRAQFKQHLDAAVADYKAADTPDAELEALKRIGRLQNMTNALEFGDKLSNKPEFRTTQDNEFVRKLVQEKRVSTTQPPLLSAEEVAENRTVTAPGPAGQEEGLTTAELQKPPERGEIVDGEDVVKHVQQYAKPPYQNESAARDLLGIDAAGQYELKDIPTRALKAGDNYDSKLAQEYATRKTAIPAIVLDQDGKTIVDGNHRVAAAKIRGDKTIKAFVALNSYQREAENAQQIVDLHKANGGSTFNLPRGNLAGTDTYAVSTNPERGQVLKAPPTAKDIQKFISKNQDLLKNPDKSVGTWADTSNGTHVLDVVSTPSDREEAIALGKQHNQKAIFDLKKGEEINTGGTGEVRTHEDMKKDPEIFWHGSPSGDMRGGASGLHVGTHEAAKQALNARIGTPVEGEWDGTREYGKTVLAGQDTFKKKGEIPTGYSAEAPKEDHLPTGAAYYSGGGKIAMDAKPNITPVRITGPMTNSTQTPHDDFKANGMMAGQIKKGTAKNGYYYTNIGEDDGSISAVVPGATHLEKLTPAETTVSPTVSTRVPTKTVKGETVEDHTDQSRMSDMEAAKAAPGYVPKMVARIQTVPGFKAPEGGDAQASADAYIRHVADNVKFVHSKLAPAEIARDEQWYPVGAHNRVQAVAKQHGFTPTQIAGVTAVESPMTDWDQNTSLAERTADIWKNQQNTKFTPEMQEAADKITSIPANAKFKSVYKSLRGKTLGQLPTVEEQAHWLRLYDEAHNPRDYQTWNPDGTSAGLAQNDDGTPRKVGWSFQNHIEKAIRILKDGSPESISKELGYGHKVRNFYNNMIAPNDPRFLTVDTHAVNIAQLRPMAGKNPDVALNFGNIKNGAYGLKGVYPMHDAGYRLAAKELDIPIPSRLQSPTWVKIREVFNDNFKTPENLQVIDAIWKEHTDGHITADQARNRVWDYATRWNDQAAAEAQHPGNAGELPQASLFGEPAAGAAGRGTGSGATGAVPEKGIAKSERMFSIAKPSKAKGKGTSALDLLNALGGLKKPAK